MRFLFIPNPINKQPLLNQNTTSTYMSKPDNWRETENLIKILVCPHLLMSNNATSKASICCDCIRVSNHFLLLKFPLPNYFVICVKPSEHVCSITNISLPIAILIFTYFKVYIWKILCKDLPNTPERVSVKSKCNSVYFELKFALDKFKQIAVCCQYQIAI